jgi:hypothetical protein
MEGASLGFKANLCHQGNVKSQVFSPFPQKITLRRIIMKKSVDSIRNEREVLEKLRNP